MTTTVESKYITLQQAQIHYLEMGQPDWPSVLFLHGASFSAQTLRDTVLTEFPKKHRQSLPPFCLVARIADSLENDESRLYTLVYWHTVLLKNVRFCKHSVFAVFPI
jgi:hypothetical protein